MHRFCLSRRALSTAFVVDPTALTIAIVTAALALPSVPLSCCCCCGGFVVVIFVVFVVIVVAENYYNKKVRIN